MMTKVIKRAGGEKFLGGTGAERERAYTMEMGADSGYQKQLSALDQAKWDLEIAQVEVATREDQLKVSLESKPLTHHHRFSDARRAASGTVGHAI
jgi:hypothetical protein